MLILMTELTPLKMDFRDWFLLRVSHWSPQSFGFCAGHSFNSLLCTPSPPILSQAPAPELFPEPSVCSKEAGLIDFGSLPSPFQVYLLLLFPAVTSKPDCLLKPR